MDVSEIIDAIDIVEYISQYIDLEQRGREYWGRSCFSVDETPSFSVDPDKKYWYCFSTSKGGNIVEFVMLHDNVDVGKAVRILKRYAHIVEDESGHVVTRLEATRIAKKYRGSHKKIPEMIAKPLPDDVMMQYEFRKDKLQLWVNEGISWETLKKYGVRYDAFDDRIVYPIKDYYGNIISVCGRTCDPDYKAKKLRKYTYKQQIGTLDTIYGYSDNREAILKAGEFILFEGAKSCMKAEEWGFQNTGALLTSHLSVLQFRFLIQLCSYYRTRIVFALDSDINILKDDNIKKLQSYARVEWVKNRDSLLLPKDSPVDQGREIWERLYESRERLS